MPSRSGKRRRRPDRKLADRQGDRHVAQHVEGHHPVEEQMRLPFVDDLDAPALAHEHRKLAEMGADEVPGAVLGALAEGEARLQPAVRLVGGDHEVLLHRGAGDLPVGALPLVHRAHVGDDEAGREQGFLDRGPDRVAGVVEDDRDPAPRLEHPPVLLEAALHQALVLGQPFALEAVDDGLRRRVGQHPVPGFDQEVEVGVVDVLAEGRIGEDVVDRVVGQPERRGRARGRDASRTLMTYNARGHGPFQPVVPRSVIPRPVILRSVVPWSVAPWSVIPAKAGIHFNQKSLDSRFRGNDRG